MKEILEIKGLLETQESQVQKERSVAPVSPAEEVQREVGVSPVSRDQLVHLDHGACRETGVCLVPEEARAQRARSQVISTSSKFVCESCKNSWLS